MSSFEKQMLDSLWNYPLFESLARRRSFRLPQGCNITKAPFVHMSGKEPVPLSELETAILCWAGHGVTGTITADLDYTTHFMNSFTGRTHPNPCNDQHQELMYIDDTGVYLYRPKAPTLNVEFQTPADREKVVTSFTDANIKILDGRPHIPEAALMKSNYFNTNKPGTTAFMPVVDVTYEYMNLILGSCAFERWQIVDDRTGEMCGLQKWVDNGYLNGPVVPLSWFEMAAFNACMSTAHYMVMNISLAATAMGLAGWHYGGYVSLILLGGTPLTNGLGFRFITGKDKMPTPVGKDGFIESLCPPYVKDMDEAVEKFYAMKYGPKGHFGKEYDGMTPWKDKEMHKKVNVPDEQSKEMAKHFLTYVYKTYGRCPAFVDAIFLPVAYAAHHPDLEFYQKYYPKEMVTDNVLNHMKIWHGKE